MNNKEKKGARGFDINSFLGLIIATILMVIGIVLTKSTDEATGEASYIINWISLVNFWDLPPPSRKWSNSSLRL